MTNIPTQVLFDKNSPIENSQLAILKQHFPNCFDKNGAFLPKKLSEIVQASDTPINKEAYSLQWLGKFYAKLLRDLPPQTLLCEDKQHNSQKGNQHSQNLLIRGDNLEVLKHLKNAYNEKVKMIYIDPPYNTGSDGFVYQDDRKFSKEQLAELTGMSEDEAERVLNFTDKKSNSHSAWLTFMYPRLYIARALLQQDGVIFISIDDNEVAQLRLLCDEVFGEENFVSQMIVVSNSSKNNANYVSDIHEYVLCYAKNIVQLGDNWKVEKAQIEEYEKRANQLLKRNLTNEEIHKELLELVKYPRFYNFDHYTYADKKGIYRTDNSGGVKNGNTKTEIIHPTTQKTCAKPSGGWRYNEETLKQLVTDDMLAFGEDETGIPTIKRYLKDYRKQVPKSVIFFDSQSTTKWFKKEGIPFAFPKAVDFIKYLCSINTNNSDLILDFFAGSGTTADAVMQLNAEDGGNRQFILVQLPELIDPKKSKTAYDFVKNELGVAEPTIFEITKERIIRSAKKILAENDNIKGDFGFKIYETVDNFCLTTDNELSPNQEIFPKQDFTEKQYQTLLTSWRLHDGNRLTDSVITKKLADYTAYLCDKNLYLLHPNFNSHSITALIESLDKEQDFIPNRIIFYGEHIDSGKQKELQQALDSYSNKKALKISLLARY